MGAGTGHCGGYRGGYGSGDSCTGSGLRNGGGRHPDAGPVLVHDGVRVAVSGAGADGVAGSSGVGVIDPGEWCRLDNECGGVLNGESECDRGVEVRGELMVLVFLLQSSFFFL